MAALAVAAMSLGAGRGEAQTQAARDSVMAPIQAFLVGLRTRDTTLMAAQLDSAARFTLLRQTQSGDTRVVVMTGSQFFRMVTGRSEGGIDEPIRNPVVHIDGPLASVWAEYQVRVGGGVSHCGFDAFHLARRASGWRILNVSDSFRRAGCGTPWPDDTPGT